MFWLTAADYLKRVYDLKQRVASDINRKKFQEILPL